MNQFRYLAVLGSLFLLVGCPMATPNGGTSATGSSSEGIAKESSPDATNSTPVAMPGGVFSSGTTPECGFVLTMTATPLCFNGDSSKDVSLKGRVSLECAENEREKPFESPTIRFVNKDVEYVELPVIREDRSFDAVVRVHQREVALDSCFINRDPVITFAAPGVLDAMPCSGEECRLKCSGFFDSVEIVNAYERNVPTIDPITGDVSRGRVNLLPPCGNGARPKADDVIIVNDGPIRAAEPVTCKPIAGGLFRCAQGEDNFCATLFGERRECPATLSHP